MSSRLIKYGFTAGIVSRELWSQTILQKYGFGLSDAENYIVRYTGSAVSRGGLVFSTLMQELDGNYRLVPFVFAREDANTFALLFTANKLRFLQNGRYQLEEAKNCVGVNSSGNNSRIYCLAHGYAVGDLVEFYGANVPAAIEGQVVEVKAVIDSNEYEVGVIGAALNLDNWAAATAFTCRRVYTLPTDFVDSVLPLLYFKQTRDVIRITSDVLNPYTLTRLADGTWQLESTVYQVTQAAPSFLFAASFSGAGTAGVVFAVTAVGANGEESLPSNLLIVNNVVDYGAVAGYITIAWVGTSDAIRYNVYRSLISPEGSSISAAVDLGFLGVAYAPVFTDRNIVPDFAKAPPSQNNPFAHKAIKFVLVTASGAGYTSATTCTVTDATGFGAEIIPIVSAGALRGVLIKNGGQDYTNPTLTFSVGAGATVLVTLSEATGNFPAVSGTHAQRQLYAATPNKPLGFWGSKVGLFDNYGFSRILAANESFSYDLTSETLGTIRHMISTRVGVLMFSDIGVWSVTGTNGVISATDVDAKLQTSVGCSFLQPLLIDADVLYGETDNQTFRLLQYNDFSKNFGGADISVLARHLISYPKDIEYWSYETRPYKLIWLTRNDGIALACTISQEQQVYAWTTHTTAGLFLANVTLPESVREVTYFLVSRYLSGRWVRTIEYLSDRERGTNYTHCGVDAAIPFNYEKQFVILDLPYGAEVNDSVTLTARSPIFGLDDVDKIIVHEGGKCVITDWVSTTEVVVTIVSPFTHLAIKNTTLNRAIFPGEWFMANFLTEWQLPLNMRPTHVTIGADAKVLTDIEVGHLGLVTFPEDLAMGYIGLNYEASLTSLPMTAQGTVIEDSRNNIKGVGLRFIDSRGIEVGVIGPEDNGVVPEFFSVQDLQSSFMAEGAELRNDHDYVVVSSDWQESNLVVVKANGANPSEISGFIVDVEVGDEVS